MHNRNVRHGNFLLGSLNCFEHDVAFEPDGAPGEAHVQTLSATVTQEKCVVCETDTHGLHFGVTTCAACGAFFRRAIAEQRIYFCKKNQNCNILHGLSVPELVTFDSVRFAGLSNRKLCRYCRFKKCLAMGMQPEKVQSKMRPVGSTTLPPIVETAEMTYTLNDCAMKYSILQRQRMNRYLPGRYSHMIQYLNEPATMSNYLTIMESEPEFVSNFLSSCGVFKGFSDSEKMVLFKDYVISSRLAEQARITGLIDQIGTNRMHLLDGSYVEATESVVIRFYSSGKTETEPPVLMDAAFLTRMTMPSARFHLDELIPAFQRLDLSDRELTALLNLVLWNTANPELSLQGQRLVRKRRQQVIKEICEHYKSTQMDIPIRFANLLLLLTPLSENTRMWKENLLLIALMKANKSTTQQDQSQCYVYDQL